jgi:tRNA 2-thiocytidine biosynthesis protein TtcA
MVKTDRAFIEMVRRQIGRAINRYNMIGDGERVLVALSGGKDSLVLLDALVARLRHLPISYTVAAAHIQVVGVPETSDPRYLGDFCAERGVQLYLESISTGSVVSEAESPCFICSWYRRKKLFDMMRELSFGKLAFGHHRDDIVETLLMNMSIQGRLGTMPMRLAMFKGQFSVIRPLGLLGSADIESYARRLSFQLPGKSCPFVEESARLQARKIVSEIQKLSPYAVDNILRSTRRINAEYLPEGI